MSDTRRRVRSLATRHVAVMLSLITSPVFGDPPPAPVDPHAIDRYVTAEQRRERIPGIELAVYRRGHVIFQKGYGVANVELNVPVRTQTLMQSGSVGKQFTATAIMMLVDEGKVSLKDSITRYFPDAPPSWKPILVENLLSHTSGLAEYGSDERTAPGGEFDMRLDFSEEELLRKMEKLPIEFAAGERWEYRNTNYVLLGFLIHKVAAMPYADFLKQRIFTPLGMHDTRLISDRDIVMNRAAGYEIDGGVLHNQTPVSPTFNSTADGSLYFDVIDLESWDRALYGTSLLGEESLKRMWTPFPLKDGRPNGAGYGFAWEAHDVNGHRVVEHGGAWQGFACHFARYLDDGLSVVVLTNLDAQHADPEQIAHVVAGIIDPPLMPRAVEPIADGDPAGSATAKRLLQALLHGDDVTPLVATPSRIRSSPEAAAELAASLPATWDKAPLVLMERVADDDSLRSAYRIGVAGDTRWLGVHTDASGKILRYHLKPDPNQR